MSLAYKFPGGGSGLCDDRQGFPQWRLQFQCGRDPRVREGGTLELRAWVQTTLADRKLFVNGAVFYTPIDNRQVYGLDLSRGAAQFIANPVPESHILGAEIEMTARSGFDNLDLSLGATLLDTKIDEYDTSVFAGTARERQL